MGRETRDESSTQEEHLLELFSSKRTRRVPKTQQEMEEMVARLGNPHQRFPSVHVAGTNGKGSVATKIARSLQEAGYRVGLFISPHVEQFGERIQINSTPLGAAEMEERLQKIVEQFPDLCFFDAVTFLAFQIFSERKVEVAVMEAGIGGLHDTTNLIHPLVSIITSVAMDHVELLGPTLEDIAFQKAGIIKPGVPAVVGPKAYFKPMQEAATRCQTRLIRVSCETEDYDEENQAVAAAALKELAPHFQIPPEALKKGLAAKPPCRFERQGRLVLDVAHNPAGFESLIKAWHHRYPGKAMNVVVGLSSDKDLAACLRIIAPAATHLFLVQASSARAASTEVLKDILLRQGFSHFTCTETVAEALEKALAREQDILICGSFYIMKQAREETLRLQIGGNQLPL